jgi:hypothetical protein
MRGRQDLRCRRRRGARAATGEADQREEYGGASKQLLSHRDSLPPKLAAPARRADDFARQQPEHEQPGCEAHVSADREVQSLAVPVHRDIQVQPCCDSQAPWFSSWLFVHGAEVPLHVVPSQVQPSWVGQAF